MGAPLPRADYIRTLRELVAHVDASCALCLNLFPGNVRLLDVTLRFFEMTNKYVARGSVGQAAAVAPLHAYLTSIISYTLSASAKDTTCRWS
jgi:hypothetical protein